MSFTNNSYFALASTQLFPLPFLEPAAVSSEDDALMRAKKAFDAYKEGRFEAAMDVYTDAIQTFPDQPFFYACRSILNSLLQDDEGSFYDYQIAKGLDFNYQAFLEWVENKPANDIPLDVESGELKGMLSDALEATQQFDYAYALALYTCANERYPEDMNVLVYRSALYQRLLRYDKALSDLNRVIDTDPVHYQAFLLRAKLFKAIQENEKARHDFDQAVILKPDAAEVYEERGGFFVDRELYEEALLDFDKLVTLLPTDFYVYTLRADLLEKMKNWEKAMKDYSKAISLNSYYSDLYAYRAEVKLHLGDTAGAAEDRRIFEELEKEDD